MLAQSERAYALFPGPLPVVHAAQHGGVLPQQVAVDWDRLATGLQHAVGHLAQLAFPTDHHHRRRRGSLSLLESPLLLRRAR